GAGGTGGTTRAGCTSGANRPSGAGSTTRAGSTNGPGVTLGPLLVPGNPRVTGGTALARLVINDLDRSRAVVAARTDYARVAIGNGGVCRAREQHKSAGSTNCGRCL